VIDDGDEEAGHVWPVFADSDGWQDHCCSACLAEAIAAGEKPETLGASMGPLRERSGEAPPSCRMMSGR
jgi:hypothetical protein